MRYLLLLVALAFANVAVAGFLTPVVTSVSPATGPAATTVTVIGQHFTGVNAVTFGATAATTFTVNSDTQITTTAPAGTGTVDITAANPSATSATSAADQFTYAATPVTLQDFSVH
jgi:IPT/TIG domain